MLGDGRFQAAADELSKMLEKDERNMRARFLLARAYGNLGNHGAGILELRQCLKIGKYSEHVTEVSLHKALAAAFLETKKYNEARDELLLLTTLEPDNFEHYYELGQILFRSQNYGKAIGVLGKSVSLNDKHADSYSLLGQSQYHMSSYQDARASLLKAVQLQPGLALAHYFLGLCLRYLQDTEWAIKEFEKAEKDESIRVQAILGKGMALIDQESYPKAITELERGIKHAGTGSEQDINMSYVLALAAEKTRDMDTAIANWEKIEALRPGFRDVRDKLKQYSEFRVDDAIKDFMIASNTQFEGICRQMLNKLGHHIINMRVVSDSQIQALATEGDGGGKRPVRKQQILLSINRDSVTPISENDVREFQEAMKEQNAGRGMMMTTGEITPAAAEYAASRPIELYDSSKLAEYVRAAV